MSTFDLPVSPCPRRRIGDQEVAGPRIADAPTGTSLLATVFEEVDIGLLVCDDRGNLMVLNWSARLELLAGGLLQMSGTRLKERHDDGELAAALSAACRQGRRQIVELRHRDDRLFLSVSPLASNGGETLALVMLGRRTPCSALVLEMLGYRQGLTAAERRILASLAARRTPAQIAVDYDISISTVRTQIIALRAKLDVDSVSALMCVVAGVPPLTPKLKPAHELPSFGLPSWQAASRQLRESHFARPQAVSDAADSCSARTSIRASTDSSIVSPCVIQNAASVDGSMLATPACA